ncbi:Gamma-aminobutyric acid receptor alpha-like [Nymphon striatum]|nr:Gamma-aminobutyric acid receptor alpha-like [Nymphon striatum]
MLFSHPRLAIGTDQHADEDEFYRCVATATYQLEHSLILYSSVVWWLRRLAHELEMLRKEKNNHFVTFFFYHFMHFTMFFPNHHKKISVGEQPTVIYTNIFIRSMGPFSDLKMEYSMDCYFRQKWTDHRLEFEGNKDVNKLSLDIKMLDRIWKPDTHFLNGLNSYLHTITRPNKFLRIDENGHVSYSMRLTIKAKCPMELQNFPMDLQSCPLMFGSYAYTTDQIIYEWDPNVTQVDFQKGMLFTQFGIIDSPYRNTTLKDIRGPVLVMSDILCNNISPVIYRIDIGEFLTGWSKACKLNNKHRIFQNKILSAGEYSILQVNFNIRRYTGYFLIQIYIPCILLVVLSWVSFWINREATADRVGLGITTVLTMSTITLDSRSDLPKVHYATAMDWFVVMSFVFVIATLLEFAGVHYFTKIGSGETYEGDVDTSDEEEEALIASRHNHDTSVEMNADAEQNFTNEDVRCAETRRSCLHKVKTCRATIFCSQFLHCIISDDSYREIHRKSRKENGVNSVSFIDRVSRVLFPFTFIILNVFYWLSYSSNRGMFSWDHQPH